MPDLHFKPRLLPSVATLLLLLLFVYLGQWQAGKAVRRSAEVSQHGARAQFDQQTITASLVDPAQLQDVPVRVRGTYEVGQTYFLDNRQENGVAGVHVISPLKIEGSETRILINRGWVAWPAQGRGTLPVVETPAGVVQVIGVAAVPSAKKFFLMPERDDARAQLWRRIDLSRYGKTHAYPVQPILLLQAPNDANDKLVRHWPPPEDRVAMHQSYAFQWYGMAFVLFVFYLVLSTRRPNSDKVIPRAK